MSRARTYTDAQGRVTDTPEWVRQQFGVRPSLKRQLRGAAQQELRALDRRGDEAAKRFRRENPGADIEDYERSRRGRAR